MGLIDSAVSAAERVGDVAAGVGAGVRQVGSTVSTTVNERTTARRMARALPEKASIADAFHRKLFSFADFDFLINYLKVNRIADCAHIYTQKTLVAYVSQLTDQALGHRRIGLLNKLYFLILRLCIRRRKGLLVYVNLETGEAKNILSWERFKEYAGFGSTVAPESIWFSPADLFPALRTSAVATQGAPPQPSSGYNVSVNSNGIPTSYGMQTPLAATAQILGNSRSQVASGQNSVQSPVVEPIRGATGMFANVSAINYDEIVLLTYNKVFELSDDLKIDADNEFDILLFWACNICGLCRSTATTKDDILSAVSMFLGITNAALMDTLSHTSGRYLNTIRRMFHVSEGDGSYNQHLLDMVSAPLGVALTEHSAFGEVYRTSVEDVKATLGHVMLSSEFCRVTSFPYGLRDKIVQHNVKCFPQIYTSLAEGTAVVVQDPYIADAIMCLVLHQKNGFSALTLEQYVTLVERLFNEYGIASDRLHLLLAKAAGNELCLCAQFRGIEQVENTDQTIHTLICQIVQDTFEISVPDPEQSNLGDLLSMIISRRQAANNTGISQQSARALFDIDI